IPRSHHNFSIHGKPAMTNKQSSPATSKGIGIEDVGKPLTYPVEAFVSEAYAELERERLWPRVWQVACRLEELPSVGSFVTYDIAGDSVIVVRTSDSELKAYHNVCPHRGRRLI